jgi:hypothetical protein
VAPEWLVSGHRNDVKSACIVTGRRVYMVSMKSCPAECKEGFVGGLPAADCSLVVGLGHCEARLLAADACLPDWSTGV